VIDFVKLRTAGFCRVTKHLLVIITLNGNDDSFYCVDFASAAKSPSTGGGAEPGGNFSPNAKAALIIFRFIKVLMFKPKKCVSANQRKCLKNLFYFNI